MATFAVSGRKPAYQTWAVGETVKVGFMTLRITAKTANGWRLVNKDASKSYEFEPHIGLFQAQSF